MNPPLPLPGLLRELPEYLRERLRPRNAVPLRRKADFVLYWCHHALRAHENPALDIAIWVGNQLRLPVLVYQGLSGSHPFNSDRHHTFILESARDLANQLSEKNICHAFYLGRNPAQSGPLSTLAGRAALVVTEDFPAPPFTTWYLRWAERLDTCFCLVDTACVVPMQSLDKPFARAYEFRNATLPHYRQRVPAMWPAVSTNHGLLGGDLGFEALDWDACRIADLCAQCAIDHSVGPVSGTPGGSQSGYSRWNSFRQHGLRGYARQRNDAAIEPPQGVSRLSPYLHYGCVSPFRIAREAAFLGGSGPDKFLDELLIWRELAHNFCFHCPNPESLEALPAWARRSLLEHAADERAALYSWEQLARAETADPLWNAAQRSLLVHGELHNNLRMTWGKAFLRWTPSPAEALRLMIDLNHRFALDGSDPNSYGGLLWCLGLFDRPFQDQPVIGLTRPRSSAAHARRLDLEHYTARVSRPAFRPGRVAVIGAGLSGLTAARTLQDHGLEVKVFDKGRSVGGRTCSRRLESVSFDHGAQYFTARNPIFVRYVESWEQLGLVQLWTGRIVTLREGRSSDTSPCPRYVGVPTMSAMSQHLADQLPVSAPVTVTAVRPVDAGWELLASNDQSWGEFETLVLALPAPQLQVLLPQESHFHEALDRVAFAPCWAIMLHFESPVPVDFDGAFVEDSPLGWVARNNSKPGRDSAEAWVLHASPEWSASHLEAPPDEVYQSLLEEFFRVTGWQGSRPVGFSPQRWRYALPAKMDSPECFWDEELRLAGCGDWCQGGRIEGAFLSGLAAAGRVLGRSVEQAREMGAQPA